ncbi:hypothetical protein FGB62_1g326 [Gracilaria domingensis]|nr:hypothetical protein FGB62_1g326 [Gracilaria domingensis]
MRRAVAALRMEQLALRLAPVVLADGGTLVDAIAALLTHGVHKVVELLLGLNVPGLDLRLALPVARVLVGVLLQLVLAVGRVQVVDGLAVLEAAVGLDVLERAGGAHADGQAHLLAAGRGQGVLAGVAREGALRGGAGEEQRQSERREQRAASSHVGGGGAGR